MSSDDDLRRIAQVVDFKVDDWHVPGPAIGETCYVTIDRGAIERDEMRRRDGCWA